jgi:hypothetical protein
MGTPAEEGNSTPLVAVVRRTEVMKKAAARREHDHDQ